MKEQEKYKQMMNEIHVSEATLRKVMEMDMSENRLNKKRMMKKIGTVAAALMMCMVASNGICYAATGQSWVTKAVIYINGEKSEQEIELKKQEDGTVSFEVEAPDDGESSVAAGFMMDEDGNMQSIDMPSEDLDVISGTVVEEDGKQYFEYNGEKIDLTEDLTDGEASGTIADADGEYRYEITQEDGAYNINVSAEE